MSGKGNFSTVAHVAALCLTDVAGLALLISQRGRISDVLVTLGHARWSYLVAAILVQGLAVASMARMHRILLDAAGRLTGIRPVLATAYAGNAISQTLPLVGSAASTVFVYRRYLALGVEKVSAAWVLMISGIYSTLAFIALSAVGALATGSIAPAVAGLTTLLVGVVPAVVIIAGLQRPGPRRILVRVIAVALTLVRPGRAPHQELAVRRAGQFVDQLAGLRLGRRRAVRAACFAMLNWSSDVACLVLALMAIGASVPWHGVLLAWAAGAGASSLGLTPGGLGVVEGALCVALIAAGLPAALAVTGVLVYRFIQLWLVTGVGAVTLLVIRIRAGFDDLKSPGSVANRQLRQSQL